LTLSRTQQKRVMNTGQCCTTLKGIFATSVFNSNSHTVLFSAIIF